MQNTTTTKARKAGQGSNWIARTTRTRIYKRDGWACVYCEAHVADEIVLSLDHVVANELGGSNNPSNLVTCCGTCNSSKQKLSLKAFLARLATKGMDIDTISRRVRNAQRRQLPALTAMEKAALAKAPKETISE